jgi:putative inorganic carbon (hco3(-)) transporter
MMSRSATAGLAGGSVARDVALPFRTDVWLWLLIASQPLESSIDLGLGTAITISKAAGTLCVAAFVLDWFAMRRTIRFDVTHAILLALLAIGLLSSLYAGLPATSLSTMTRYAGFVALYVVLTQFTAADGVFARVAWALSVGCAVAGVLALRNFADGTTLLARPLYGDPNDLAYMLATTLPFTLWLMRRRGWRRVAALCMIAVILATLALTFSRGAWLAIAAGLAWLVVRERRYRTVVVVAALISAAPLVWFVTAHEQQVTTGLSAKALAAGSNVTDRLAFYRVAAELTDAHLVLGVGPGNFPKYLNEVGGGPSEAAMFVVHDAYLEVAAELGLPALALFLTYLVIVFRRASTSHSPDGFDVALRVALIIAIVGALPLSEQYYSPLWVLGGLATVLFASDRRREAQG